MRWWVDYHGLGNINNWPELHGTACYTIKCHYSLFNRCPPYYILWILEMNQHRQANKQTETDNRQTDRHDRQADRQKYRQTHIGLCQVQRGGKNLQTATWEMARGCRLKTALLKALQRKQRAVRTLLPLSRALILKITFLVHTSLYSYSHG